MNEISIRKIGQDAENDGLHHIQLVDWEQILELQQEELQRKYSLCFEPLDFVFYEEDSKSRFIRRTITKENAPTKINSYYFQGKENLFVIGGAEYGKTTFLKFIGLTSAKLIPFFIDLSIHKGKPNLEELIQTQCDILTVKTVLQSFNDILFNNRLLLLVDNFDLGTEAWQQTIIDFCHTLSEGIFCDNRVCIASRRPLGLNLPETFSVKEFAPWSWEQAKFLLTEIPHGQLTGCRLTATPCPHHFKMRLDNGTYPPELVNNIAEINRVCGGNQYNLAACLEFYFSSLVHRILFNDRNTLKKLDLENLIMAVADAAEEGLIFSERELSNKYDRIRQNASSSADDRRRTDPSGGSGTSRMQFGVSSHPNLISLPWNTLWSLLLDGEIIEQYDLHRARFTSRPLHLYLIARHYIRLNRDWSYFGPSLVAEPQWKEISLYYLELVPKESRSAIAQQIMQSFRESDDQEMVQAIEEILGN